ncbi:MAG TPA: PQQ-dependent sugar dehydrogenase [Candidatus Eisenbacteria bacterium]|nr:PQQ-dependent sugar dehydrogenase [Candidatus Eisenbacteria bacterium]
MKWVGVVVIVILFILVLVVFQWYGNVPKRLLTQLATPVPTHITTPTDAPRLTVIAKNLQIPWEIVFLPNNDALITERPGKVILLSPSGDGKTIATLSQVRPIGEGGLLGMALSPKFPQNHFIYLYYTYSSNGLNTLNKVVRMTFENNTLSSEKVLLDNIPGSSNHNGGRIKFGPDGNLYITTGDAENPSQAQSTNALGGKILRITEDGKIPSDNPFANYVYSYGHRNPQGLAWDSSDNLWETEHGRSSPTGYDEVNRIEKGKNYGWPTIQGNETKSGMVTPLLNSGPTTTWAPSGMVFYNNELFFVGLKGNALYEVKNLSSSPSVVEHLKSELGRIRDVVVGPDNFLYILTNNTDGRGVSGPGDDKLIRIDVSKL